MSNFLTLLISTALVPALALDPSLEVPTRKPKNKNFNRIKSLFIKQEIKQGPTSISNLLQTRPKVSSHPLLNSSVNSLAVRRPKYQPKQVEKRSISLPNIPTRDNWDEDFNDDFIIPENVKTSQSTISKDVDCLKKFSEIAIELKTALGNVTGLEVMDEYKQDLEVARLVVGLSDSMQNETSESTSKLLEILGPRSTKSKDEDEFEDEFFAFEDEKVKEKTDKIEIDANDLPRLVILVQAVTKRLIECQTLIAKVA